MGTAIDDKRGRHPGALDVSRRGRGRRRALWVAAGLVALVSTALAALWLAAHHIPSWYHPVYVPEHRLDEVRSDAARTFNRFGDGLVRRRPFTLVLDEHRIGEWIDARERIWPGSGAWVPSWLNDPVIRLHDGQLTVSARVELEGYQFIAVADLSVEIGSDDILIIRLERIAAGSLPLPVGLLGDPLTSLLRLEGLDLDYLPAPVAEAAEYFRESDPIATLSKGVRRANRFIWENGRRPYRIESLTFADGQLTLGVDPL